MCKVVTIKKSLIVRVIMSVSFFVLFIFLLTFFDSRDQGIPFFEFLKNFFVLYSKPIKDFEFIDIWYGLIDLTFNNNIVWISIFMFFPQLTLLISQFLFDKYKKYTEYQEIAVTERVEVSVDNYGNVSEREANVYNTVRPYLYKTVLALIGSVAIFIPILFAVIKFISPIFSMLIVVVIDIIVITLACIKKRKI